MIEQNSAISRIVARLVRSFHFIISLSPRLNISPRFFRCRSVIVSRTSRFWNRSSTERGHFYTYLVQYDQKFLFYYYFFFNRINIDQFTWQKRKIKQQPHDDESALGSTGHILLVSLFLQFIVVLLLCFFVFSSLFFFVSYKTSIIVWPFWVESRTPFNARSNSERSLNKFQSLLLSLTLFMCFFCVLFFFFWVFSFYFYVFFCSRPPRRLVRASQARPGVHYYLVINPLIVIR